MSSVQNTELSPRERRLANLKPHWKQGDASPNPAGRPKKKPLTSALEEIYSDPKEAMYAAKAIAKLVRKGNYKAFAEVADRLEGRVMQQIEHTGNIIHEITTLEQQMAKQSLAKIRDMQNVIDVEPTEE